MSEFTFERITENLENLKIKNTLEIIDNYLEMAIKENLNIVDVLDHILSEEARSKRKRAYKKQIQMSGFPIKKVWKILISHSSPPLTNGRLMNLLLCDL